LNTDQPRFFILPILSTATFFIFLLPGLLYTIKRKIASYLFSSLNKAALEAYPGQASFGQSG
jgi:hypothetical protein